MMRVTRTLTHRRSATTLAGRLVENFGRPAEMRKLYASDVRWELPPSLGNISGPHEGIDAVAAFNRRVWEAVYFDAESQAGDACTVQILDEVGGADSASSAVRFIYKATYRNGHTPYENEYTVFVRARDGLIQEVFEGLDTMRSVNAFARKPVDHNPYRAPR